MIISMTGFGRGESSEGGLAVSAEIKSVNSRYLDISLRLPQALQEKELAIKELIRERVSRGKFSVTVRLDQADTGRPEVTFNPRLVRGYKDMLEELREAAAIEKPVTLGDLMTFEEIFVARERDPSTLRAIWELSREALAEALENLVEMRRKEGSQMENDLRERVDRIDALLDKIAGLTEGRAEEARRKLLERIDSLVSDDTLDRERLEMEVAVLVDKMDITEEIVRMQSHLKFFREALGREEAVGRRLNFLSQEMNREINTIGSKANHSEISRHVVHAKENLEQIREQIQNIE